VPLGTTIVLSPQELQESARIGGERYDQNVLNNSKDANWSNRDSRSISVQGGVTEWMFCRLFDIDPTPMHDTRPRNRHTDTLDAKIGDFTIDVKSTMGHQSDLWVATSKDVNIPDFYCLITLERENQDPDAPFGEHEKVQGKFCGFIHSGVLRVGGNVKQRGRKTFFIVPQKKLGTLEQVMAIDADELPRLF